MFALLGHVFSQAVCWAASRVAFLAAFLAAFMDTFLATFLAAFLAVFLAALLVTADPQKDYFPEGVVKTLGEDQIDNCTRAVLAAASCKYPCKERDSA